MKPYRPTPSTPWTVLVGFALVISSVMVVGLNYSGNDGVLSIPTAMASSIYGVHDLQTPATNTLTGACGGCVVESIPVGTNPRGIVVDSLTGDVYAANGATGNMSIIPGGDSTTSVSISMNGSTNLEGAAFDPANGNVYVANYGSGVVDILHGSSLIGAIPVGSNPVGVLYDPINGNLYVTNNGGSSLTEINGLTGSVVSTVSANPYPFKMALDPHTGNIFVSNNGLGYDSVTVINSTTLSIVGTVHVGSVPQGIAYDSANGNIYVANYYDGTVSVINGSTFALVSTISVPSGPWDIAYDTNNGYLYVTEYNSSALGIIDGATNVLLGQLPVGTYPWGVAYDGLNGNIYVTNYGSNNVSVVTVLKPAISFTSATTGPIPLTVSATGSISGGLLPDNFSWNFGDGTSGYGTAVSHTYLNPPSGCTTPTCSFNVQLLVKDGYGSTVSTTASVSVLVNVTSPFFVSIAESPATGTAPLNVTFSAAASGGIAPYSYTWVFGDGSTGSGGTVSHVYTVPGTYPISLRCIHGQNSSATALATVQVVPAPSNNSTGPMELAINADPVTGQAPLNTHFHASVSGGVSPYSFEWSFGDHSATVSGASVNHDYALPGEYVATVVATDATGQAATSGVFITVSNGSTGNDSIAAFVTMFSMHGTAPRDVTFTPSIRGGTAPYTLKWDFGDGSSTVTSQSQSGNFVTHTYTIPGIYFPKLTVTDSKGTQTVWSLATSGNGVPVKITPSPSSKEAWYQSLPLTDWVALAGLIVLVVIVAAVAVSSTKRPPPTSTPRIDDSSPYAPYQLRPEDYGPNQSNRGRGSPPTSSTSSSPAITSEDPLGNLS